jgi:polar amino acid transport system permease protein
MDYFDTLGSIFFDFDSMLAVLPEMLAYGFLNTLILAATSMVIGIVLGLLVALLGLSPARPLRVIARIYTDIFRGLPAVLTILLIGQGLAPLINPLTGGNPYPLGILALSLISSAYIGEIFRAGIQSIDKGQLEAARALGMSRRAGLMLVVVPQGIRSVLPSLVNQFIAVVKDSSLVFFLGLLLTQRDLFRVGQDASVLQGNLSPLVLAGVFYLVITVPLTHLVNYIDQHLRRGRRLSADDAPEVALAGTGPLPVPHGDRTIP